MHRLASFLILLALALPYARAPLCQAGSHEHAEHHTTQGMSRLAEVRAEGLETGADCHSLMGCAVVLQASLPAAPADFRSAPLDFGAPLAGAAAQLRSRASPDTPPPKIV